MRPIPKHLLHLMEISPHVAEDEKYAEGRLRCPCEGTSFNLMYPGHTHNRGIPCTAKINGKFYFIIRAICLSCRTDHLLLDRDFHGWNGFIGHDAKQAALPRPALVPWTCIQCSETPHRATICIYSEGKADFIREVGGKFSPDDWAEGFGSFAMDITCLSCQEETPAWIDYETM